MYSQGRQILDATLIEVRLLSFVWLRVNRLLNEVGELIVCNVMMYAMHGMMLFSQNKGDYTVCTCVVNDMTYECKCMDLTIIRVVVLLEAGKINPS